MRTRAGRIPPRAALPVMPTERKGKARQRPAVTVGRRSILGGRRIGPGAGYGSEPEPRPVLRNGHRTTPHRGGAGCGLARASARKCSAKSPRARALSPWRGPRMAGHRAPAGRRPRREQDNDGSTERPQHGNSTYGPRATCNTTCNTTVRRAEPRPRADAGHEGAPVDAGPRGGARRHGQKAGATFAPQAVNTGETAAAWL